MDTGAFKLPQKRLKYKKSLEERVFIKLKELS